MLNTPNISTTQRSQSWQYTQKVTSFQYTQTKIVRHVFVNSYYYSGIYNPVIVPGIIVSLDIGEGYKDTNYYTGKYIYNTSNYL